MNLKQELLQSMEKILNLGMKMSIDQTFEMDEEELLSKFKDAACDSLEDKSSGMFGLMFVIGTFGTVLITKYERSEKELIKLIKETNGDFIKELQND
ncbi:hypothetical protein [Anaerococcus sp. Marseille-Q5996]|uniref:hypothetical protein n=1 Tax=Anaerococcus sp. Marseille-Q5996 TaxID=2972769 RepID=UPI0021C99CBE|nr:hypothetical protein [Anaerococcus sp. Marseille-Q5996]